MFNRFKCIIFICILNVNVSAGETKLIETQHKLSPPPAQFPGPNLSAKEFNKLSDLEKRDIARKLSEKLSIELGIPKTHFSLTFDYRYLFVRNSSLSGMVNTEYWNINSGVHEFRIRHPRSQSHMPELVAIGNGVEEVIDEGKQRAEALLDDAVSLYSNTGASVDGQKFVSLGISLQVESKIQSQFSERDWRFLSLELQLDGQFLVSNLMDEGFYIFNSKNGEIAYIAQGDSFKMNHRLFEKNNNDAFVEAPMDGEYYWQPVKKKILRNSLEERKLKSSVLKIASTSKIPLEKFKVQRDEKATQPLVFAMTSSELQINRQYKFWNSVTGELMFELEDGGRAGDFLSKTSNGVKQAASKEELRQIRDLMSSGLKSKTVFVLSYE